MGTTTTVTQKILFLVNPVSGPGETNWSDIIRNHFHQQPEQIEIITIPKEATTEQLRKKIIGMKPDIAVAVGGDGTIKLVAESVLQTEIRLGILPAGSANGMAKELGIPIEPKAAMRLLVTGSQRTIHLVRVNGHVCIHLSDIGYNADLVRRFEHQSGRGNWGYLRAAAKALFRHPVMEVTMTVGNEKVELQAAMIVLANGTMYGSGALINPVGNLDDALFEVIVIKKISAMEIFKMLFTHAEYNPEKTVLYQTNHLYIRSKRPVHFQVDGEYLGKIKSVEASLLPAALQVIVPKEPAANSL